MKAITSVKFIIHIILQVNNKWVLKSGTDFRNFSQLTLTFTGSEVKVDIEEFEVSSKYDEDEEVKKVVDEFMGMYKKQTQNEFIHHSDLIIFLHVGIMGEKMEHVLGNMEVELDGKFCNVRTKETNLGKLKFIGPANSGAKRRLCKTLRMGGLIGLLIRVQWHYHKYLYFLTQWFLKSVTNT